MTQSNEMERARFLLELVSAVALLITLYYNGKAVDRSTEAVEASNEQLDLSRFQSVYERQLDVWKLAAEHPELAPYIVGGYAEGKVAPDDTKAVGDGAARKAALLTGLDFYNYIYVQLQPPNGRTGTNYKKLGFDANDVPKGVDVDDWKSWVTWSWTIRQGFADAPSLCDRLRESGGAYEEDFRRAVLVPPVCASG